MISCKGNGPAPLLFVLFNNTLGLHILKVRFIFGAQAKGRRTSNFKSSFGRP